MKAIWSISLILLLPTVGYGKHCNPNTVLQKVFTSDSDSVNLEITKLDLKKMNKQIIEDAQDGKHFSYWVDADNQIHFSDITGKSTADSFTVLQDINSKDAFIIKESGEFSFDPSSKKFIYEQKKSWDLKPGEIDDAIREQTKLDFSRKADPRFEKTKVLKCTEIMASQQRADNFVLDGIVSGAIVTVSSFATVEAISPGNRTFSEKLTLLSSDLVGNTISSAISSKVVKPLILRNAGVITDFTQRTVTDFGTNYLVKKPIYNAFNPAQDQEATKNKESLGNKLVPYDTGYSIIRFFPKRAIERATVYTLPKLMLESCLKSNSASFIIGPRNVRIVDRYAWGLIYMGGRKVYLNQLDEENEK